MTDWRELAAVVFPFRGGKNGEDTTNYREENPGTLLFRSNRHEKLYVVFLVGENPTSGIDKRALRQAIELISQDQSARAPLPIVDAPAEQGAMVVQRASATVPQGSDKGQPPRVLNPSQIEKGAQPTSDPLAIRIVGPYFTGSETSLRMVLHDPIYEDKHITFDVISGEAMGVNRKDFRIPRRVKFQATVNPTNHVLRATLHYLAKRDQSHSDDSPFEYPAENVALLRESNTGFGQAKIEHLKSASLIELRFPLHMAWLRSRYEEARRRREEKLNLPSLDSLVPRLGNKAPNQDSLPLQDSATTISANGEVLQNILSIIRRQRIRYVGILASDPRDQIMLASAIRDLRLPVQIFLLGSDLLLTLPEYSYSLKGTIIGSTYPLIPANQDRTAPDDEKKRLFFPSQAVQGYYNAILAQTRAYDPMIEYRPPLFRKATDAKTIPSTPPVWISMIGQNGDLVPLQFFTHRDDDAKGYVWEKPASQTAGEKSQIAFPPTTLPALLLLLSLCVFVACSAMWFWRSPSFSGRPPISADGIPSGHLSTASCAWPP